MLRDSSSGSEMKELVLSTVERPEADGGFFVSRPPDAPNAALSPVTCAGLR